MADEERGATTRREMWDELGLDHLRQSAQDLVSAVVERAVGSVGDRLEDVIGRLSGYADNGGGPGLTAALTGGKKLLGGAGPVKGLMSAGAGAVKEKVQQAVGGSGGRGGGGRGGSERVVNIVEETDIGLPIRVVYDQWTNFEDFPSFTRKVESVEQESDEKLNWRAQIFLSHRSGETTLLEQIPDTRIVWSSTGAHGAMDGTVTFHEITPTLTRVLLVVEYHPQGFMEKTANLWRAQGRRVRSDFRHIKRHMMTHTVLEQDEIEGWRGEIRGGEVVRTHEESVEREGAEQGRAEEGRERGEEYEYDRDEYDEDEYADDYDQDEYAEDESEGEYADEEYAPEPEPRRAGAGPSR